MLTVIQFSLINFTDSMTMIKKSKVTEPESSVMCFNPSLSL